MSRLSDAEKEEVRALSNKVERAYFETAIRQGVGTAGLFRAAKAGAVQRNEILKEHGMREGGGMHRSPATTNLLALG
jgi:hypothetical protein